MEENTLSKKMKKGAKNMEWVCIYTYIYIYICLCVCFWYLTYLSRFFAKSRGTKLVLRASLRPFAIVRHSWQCSWCLHNCWFWCDQARFLRPTGAGCLGSNFSNETAAGDSDVMAKKTSSPARPHQNCKSGVGLLF